jgi:hypothetical protein
MVLFGSGTPSPNWADILTPGFDFSTLDDDGGDQSLHASAPALAAAADDAAKAYGLPSLPDWPLGGSDPFPSQSSGPGLTEPVLDPSQPLAGGDADDTGQPGTANAPAYPSANAWPAWAFDTHVDAGGSPAAMDGQGPTDDDTANLSWSVPGSPGGDGSGAESWQDPSGEGDKDAAQPATTSNPAAASAPPNLKGFPPEVVASALRTQRKTGLPASASLAQWVWESGWGKHIPSGSNNPFGIKATGDQPYVIVPTREWDSKNQKYYMTQAKFRKFASSDDAFDAHAAVLMEKRYSDARKKLPDVDGFVDALAPIYGSDKNYIKNIKSTIHNRNLTVLDKK